MISAKRGRRLRIEPKIDACVAFEDVFHRGCKFRVQGPIEHQVNSRRLSVSDRARFAVVGLEIVLLMLFLPFVAYDITRMASYIIPVYNEGWNAYHTSRFLATGQLYAPLSPFPLTPVNYPPLSFLVIGGLSVLAGDLIMTGRLVALISYVTVGALVFLIVRELTSNGYAAGLAGTLWLAIVAKNAEGYVGVYEPQLLGHAFATGALYLYVRWAACLTPTRSAVLAVACCMAVFTKHLLIAVPLTLLMTMFFTNRKGLLPFILTAFGVGTLAVLGSWAIFGNDFFANVLIERNRTWSLTYGLRTGEWLIARLGAVFLALPFVLRRHTVGDRVFAAVYFGLAFLIGVCAAAGAGAGAPWFDFAVASCLIVGLAVSDLLAATAHRRYARSLMWVAVVGCLVPVLIGLLRTDLVRLRQYVTLREDNKRLNADVALLRSTAGPALFEIPALGFRAGKEFLFDVFFGSQLIATGRFSERPLIERIEQGYFQSIVLEDDPADTLRAIDPSGRMASRPRIANDSNGRWTVRTLAAIAKHYEPLNAQGHYFRFYVPRRAGGGAHQ